MSHRVRFAPSGVYVSKPTKDVTSGNLNDFLVHPSLQLAGIVYRGTVSTLYLGSYSSTIAYYQAVYAHGLGFVPLVSVSSAGGANVSVDSSYVYFDGAIYPGSSAWPNAGSAPPSSVQYTATSFAVYAQECA